MKLTKQQKELIDKINNTSDEDVLKAVCKSVKYALCKMVKSGRLVSFDVKEIK